MNLTGGIWTALRMRELIRSRHAAFHALMREVDGIIVPREWVRTLLVRNGVPGSKIILTQHGLSSTRDNRVPIIDVAKRPLRVAFLGRADKVKGADTLIKAIRSSPRLDVEVDLFGVTQSTDDGAYWKGLQQLADQDKRISVLPPVPHDQVISLLREYHVLAVPSRWLETGPLVILESFAAGTPVIGSDLGGIADLVRHEDNGLLVEAENLPAWVEALHRCAEDRCLLARLRRGVDSPRDMIDVAQDIAQLYRKQLDSAKLAPISAFAAESDCLS
jgi:glycosyltransferase involved in cell wall biosynthesis